MGTRGLLREICRALLWLLRLERSEPGKRKRRKKKGTRFGVWSAVWMTIVSMSRVIVRVSDSGSKLGAGFGNIGGLREKIKRSAAFQICWEESWNDIGRPILIVQWGSTSRLTFWYLINHWDEEASINPRRDPGIPALIEPPASNGGRKWQPASFVVHIITAPKLTVQPCYRVINRSFSSYECI